MQKKPDIAKVISQRRKELGYEVDQIAESLKIRREYILALEAKQYDLLPTKVYLWSYLRDYAKYLGLDGDNLVEQLKSELIIKKELNQMSKTKPRNKYPYIIFAMLAIVFMCHFYFFWQDDKIDYISHDKNTTIGNIIQEN